MTYEGRLVLRLTVGLFRQGHPAPVEHSSAGACSLWVFISAGNHKRPLHGACGPSLLAGAWQTYWLTTVSKRNFWSHPSKLAAERADLLYQHAASRGAIECPAILGIVG